MRPAPPLPAGSHHSRRTGKRHSTLGIVTASSSCGLPHSSRRNPARARPPESSRSTGSVRCRVSCSLSLRRGEHADAPYSSRDPCDSRRSPLRRPPDTGTQPASFVMTTSAASAPVIHRISSHERPNREHPRLADRGRALTFVACCALVPLKRSCSRRPIDHFCDAKVRAAAFRLEPAVRQRAEDPPPDASALSCTFCMYSRTTAALMRDILPSSSSPRARRHLARNRRGSLDLPRDSFRPEGSARISSRGIVPARPAAFSPHASSSTCGFRGHEPGLMPPIRMLPREATRTSATRTRRRFSAPREGGPSVFRTTAAISTTLGSRLRERERTRTRRDHRHFRQVLPPCSRMARTRRQPIVSARRSMTSARSRHRSITRHVRGVRDQVPAASKRQKVHRSLICRYDLFASVTPISSAIA